MPEPIIILGAGPAGLVTAAALLKEGIDVVVIEKSLFPRRIVGESLLPISMEHFEAVGFLDSLNSAGFEIKTGARFIKKGKVIDFSFSEQYNKEARTWTWQVPRDKFDNILAEETVKMGGTIHFGAEVQSIDFDHGENLKVGYEQGGKRHELIGSFLVDSSGFGTVVPRILNLPVARSQTPNWAIYTHVKDIDQSKYENPGRISFEIPETDLWFWSIPFSNGVTSLGFVGHKRHFDIDRERDPDYFNDLIEKHIVYFKDRFHNKETLFRPEWYKGFSQSVGTLYGDKYVITGNCAEFLDPVFSSGVALATSSAIQAAKRIVDYRNGKDPDWEGYVEHMRQGIDVFRFYVNSWYSGDLQNIFFYDQFNQSIKEKLCSVLAGYVWDDSNEFVAKRQQGINALAQIARG